MFGMATKYCQANSTAAASAMARKRFLLLVLFMGVRFARRNGIITRRTAEPLYGMTAQQPPRRQIQAFQRAVNLDRFQRIGGTGRLEAASRRQHRRDEVSIETDRRDQQDDGDTVEQIG